MTEPGEAASLAPGDGEGQAAARERWRMLRPLANRDFRALFSAVVLSIFAAGMWAVVMVYAVIATGGGPLDLSLVAASNATGLLLCAIPGGIVADRVSRRLIVRAVSLTDLEADAIVHADFHRGLGCTDSGSNLLIQHAGDHQTHDFLFSSRESMKPLLQDVKPRLLFIRDAVTF